MLLELVFFYGDGKSNSPAIENFQHICSVSMWSDQSDQKSKRATPTITPLSSFINIWHGTTFAIIAEILSLSICSCLDLYLDIFQIFVFAYVSDWWPWGRFWVTEGGRQLRPLCPHPWPHAMLVQNPCNFFFFWGGGELPTNIHWVSHALLTTIWWQYRETN